MGALRPMQGKAFEAIHVGDRAQLRQRIGPEELARFVALTGDTNPLHVDPSFAARTPFKEVVVHGLLGATYVSTLLGTQLPGEGALWLSQAFEFLRPVRLGDELLVAVEVLAKHEGTRILELGATIWNQHRQVVLEGRGKVQVLEAAAPEVPSPVVGPGVALVTGASGGIGQAIARRLARDGWALALAHHRPGGTAQALVEAIQAEGGRAVALLADLRDEAGVAALVAEAEARLGPIQGLVHAASGRIGALPWDQLRWEDVQGHLELQVKATLALAQRVAPGMKARGHGRIVAISSMVLDGQPTPGWTAYAVGKAALVGLLHQLAAELGPHGITVNAVAPGLTETALVGELSEKQRLLLARQSPTRRLGRPEDVAGAVAYLLSAEAAQVCGETLRVNGGGLMR